MREAKNSKGKDNQTNNVPETENNIFNTLPGVDANLGTGADENSNVDNSHGQQMYGQNMNQDANQAMYGQGFNQDLSQMYGQNMNQDANQAMYGQGFNQDPNQMYGQNMSQDPNQVMYGQGFNQDPNQMYGQNMSQDPNQVMYGQGFNQDPSQMYGQDMNQDPNQAMYGQGFNQDPNQMYGQDMNQDPNQMYGQDMNQDPSQAMYGQDPNQDPSQMYGQNMNQDPNQAMYGQGFNQDPNQMYGQNMSQDPNQAMYGQDFNQNQNQMYDQDMSQGQNQSANQEFNANAEESFARAWMGAFYDKAGKQKFSLGAAFFQGIYLLYKKMYGTGILVIILEEIVCILLSLLLNINKILALIMFVFIMVLYFVGMGFGFYPLYKSFIKKKYKESTKKTSDPNQLQSIASKSGGTSIAGIFIGIVISVIILIITSALVNKDLFKIGSNKKPTNTTTNAISNNVETDAQMEEEFNFFDKYNLVYNGATWAVDSTNTGLVSGNYTLSYKANYKAEDLNADFSSQDSLASLLKLLTDSFTNQVAQLNMQVEAGSNNFIKQNNCYYAYIDVLASDSISRYYFVVLPDENILFQFVLTAADTAIDYSTNLNVIDMITKIQVKGEDENNIDQNEILNTIGNTLSNEATENSNGQNAQNGNGQNANTLNGNGQNANAQNNNVASSQTQNSGASATTNTQNGNLSSFINNQ